MITMTRVGIRQLRRQLSRYIRAAQEGEDIVITDRNRAVGRLVGNEERPRRKLRSRRRLRQRIRAAGIPLSELTGRLRDDERS